MHDINFFSVYKKKRSKSSGLKKFAIVFLAIYLLVNGGVLLGENIYFSSYESSIQINEAQLNSAETLKKMADANKIKQEAALASEYLVLLKNATAKLTLVDTLNTALLDRVRKLTPVKTRFTLAEYKGNQINFECLSTLVTDPMDMYHAFVNDPSFTNVTLTDINISADGNVQFKLMCQLAGGVSK